MLAALSACQGRPTLLINTEHLSVDIKTARKLVLRLSVLGVVGLTVPSPSELFLEITGHLKGERTSSGPAGDAVRMSASQVCPQSDLTHCSQAALHNLKASGQPCKGSGLHVPRAVYLLASVTGG